MKEFPITKGFGTDVKDLIGKVELSSEVVELIEATWPMGHALAPSFIVENGQAKIQSFSIVMPSQAMQPASPEVKP